MKSNLVAPEDIQYSSRNDDSLDVSHSLKNGLNSLSPNIEENFFVTTKVLDYKSSIVFLSYECDFECSFTSSDSRLISHISEKYSELILNIFNSFELSDLEKLESPIFQMWLTIDLSVDSNFITRYGIDFTDIVNYFLTLDYFPSKNVYGFI